MMFNSIAFLIAFAVFLILYGFCPERLRRYLLLAAGAVFVAVNSWPAAIWALVITAANFLLGLCVERTSQRKAAMGFAAAFNVVALVGFKLLDVSMLGASFYLFSFISYLADIGRGTIRAEIDPLRFASFSFFFPKYIQGPITRYDELSGQFDRPRYSLSNVQTGLSYFITGLAMKVLVADKLGVLFGGKYEALSTIGYESIDTKLAWLGAISTSLNIFVDWQAYTFMAIGIAGALGYKLPQNFNYPYMARTIGDYYRRWHMTLMRWFKDYVYIPLGGSRKGLCRTIANVLLVWLLTSLWHANGLSAKYLIWGLLATAAVIADPIWSRAMSRRFRENDQDGDSPLPVKILGHIWLIAMIPISVLVLRKPANGLNFLLWGLTIGACIVLERLWKTYVTERLQIGRRLEKNPAVSRIWNGFVTFLAHVWVLIPILVTWVMFTIRDYGELSVYLGRLFPAAGQSGGASELDFWDKWNAIGPYVLVGTFLCFPYLERWLLKLNHSRVGRWVLSAAMAILFWITVYHLQKSGSDPMGYAAF
ncbi:MAG: MBOAT family protein [Oscillospiraceae bacterium]|nr:MBOAT family protein [Oscillospiraceae bacterium]